MERKTFQTVATKVDEAQGIVEHIIAVMGNLDMGNDIIHPGAFSKTISERGTKVRVLDAHNTDSIMRVIGKPRSMREIGKNELPLDLVRKYPDAVGALQVETQYLMNTPEGKGAFERIQSGAVDEYSIGYDPLDFDFSTVTHEGKEVTARNLRTLKLYEYSPVLWAMNPATTTLSAKEMPSEGKPWNVFKEDGKWRVYKLDADGNPTGEMLGEHESEEEARAQVRALYANEGKDEKYSDEQPRDDSGRWASDGGGVVGGSSGGGGNGATSEQIASVKGRISKYGENGMSHQESMARREHFKENIPEGTKGMLLDTDRGEVTGEIQVDDDNNPVIATVASRELTEPSGRLAGTRYKAKGFEYQATKPNGKTYMKFGDATELFEPFDSSLAYGSNKSKDIKAGRRMSRNKVELLHTIEAALSELRKWADYDDEEEEEELEEMTAPEKAAETKEQEAGAGPDTPPTQDNLLLKLIELEQSEIDILEV